jgi:hypothetical protein
MCVVCVVQCVSALGTLAHPPAPQICAEHEKLIGVDPATAKKVYLQMASDLPFYGCLPFFISVRLRTAQ